ncbi:MAG: RNA polymerase factor sigma-54 [Planctomycetota bacterium]|nr:RNA polymerase factor sigma-54 [Planctomycetota bacterium]
MRLDVSQQFRLEQRMKLSPRIIQAMEILQLPLLALQERIEAELQSNPVLELQEPVTEDEAQLAGKDEPADRDEQPMIVDEANGNREDFSRLADFEDAYGSEFAYGEATPRPKPAPASERDRKLDAMANAPAPEESLNEYLTQQWTFVDADEAVKQAGLLIINRIDDDGYLRTPLAELAAQTAAPATVENLHAALKLVQTLDPLGVGAQDLKECLLIQLAAESATGRDVSLETELVANFLRDIEMNRLPQIAKRTGRTIDEIKEAIENLSHLNPRPGSLVGASAVPVVQPDVIVDLDKDGDPVIAMSDRNAPRLYISKSYRQMARDRKIDKDTRQFIRKNIHSAQWLIGAIQQRRQTVLRVVEEVFRVQREFLESGREALRPLPMADVAGKVGVHVATVSRAVAGKYVQTPLGIYPLRMFFSGGTTTAEGRDVAWDAVKAKLAEAVAAEDKSAPLSDDELKAELARHGIHIARRTVAKYRNLLNIPLARKRRQY